MSAVERLKLKLARVTVPPYVRVREGQVEHVDGYTYDRQGFTPGEAVTTLRTQGGVSARPSGYEPHHGFMVSLPGSEESFSADSLSEDRVQSYMDRHKAELSRPQVYFGGWYDGESGKVFLDLSENVPTMEEAVKRGKERKQLAVYDVDKGSEVRLAAEKPRRTFLPKDAKKATEILRGLVKR